MIKLPWIDPSLFTEYQWGGGCFYDCFGFHLRSKNVIAYKDVLKLYATGYCKSESLFVRIKEGQYAVMFEKDGLRWWNHLRKEEFFTVWVEDRDDND